VVALTTLGLCVTAGTLAGQVFGTRWAVRAARPPAWATSATPHLGRPRACL